MGDALPIRAVGHSGLFRLGDPAERFDAWIVASMGSGVLGVDASGAVAVMNAGARRILACPSDPAERVLGRPCGEVLATRPQVARLLLDALRRPHALSRAELLLEAGGQGPPVTIGFTLSPVRDPSGGPSGAAMIFRDLAPIERQDERERLRDRLAALGQMAAGLAHEIRNPLASLEVALGLLRRRLERESPVLSLLDEMQADLRGLAATVSASLDHVRPLAPDRNALAAVPLLEEALATALARVPFAGRIDREYAQEAPPLVGDAEQLRKALTELIVNAFEAMSGRAGAMRLTLGVRVSQASASQGDGDRSREVALLVSDTGPGIAAELREKVFYPFFTTRPGGSGLGLPSAQKIAAAHGGGIDIESRPGACTVGIRLPVEEGA
jgi:nitrogen-specific signal transduction histidine kinase